MLLSQLSPVAAVAEIGRLLSSPTRVAILQYLLKADCCICRDLTKMTGYAQPTVSKHLAELRTAGLVEATPEGTTRKYCINAANWFHARDQLAKFFGEQPLCCPTPSTKQ